MIARYKRLAGFETLFVMGNDEHSQNVFRKAREAGPRSARLLRPDGAASSATAWDLLDISYDDFIRTTQPRHKAAVQELVRRIAANGDVYEGYYEGWYCVGCEAFKQEKDLVDGKCPLHSTVDWIKEKNHFFRLSKYRDALLAHFAAHPEFVEPDVAPERDPAAARRRARRHLDQPRRAVVGHSRARTIRRASSTSGSTR